MSNLFSDLRRDYSLRRLSESEVLSDPIAQFEFWFKEACEAGIPEANAMVVATVGASGRPTTRVVLLKGIEAGSLVFFSNYHSRKGCEIAENGWVSAHFFWEQLQRQVRIEGRAVRVSPADSDAYFVSRPRDARIGAWASQQSDVVPGDREYIEQRYAQLQEQFMERDIPRPDHWGGYRIEPDQIEFWQGRSNRLHDRLRYCKDGSAWRMERLWP